MKRVRQFRTEAWVAILAIATAFGSAQSLRAGAASQSAGLKPQNQYGGEYGGPTFCEQRPWLCTDSSTPIEGHYVGHDEPSLLFYSSTPGSGNSATYTLTLPTEPAMLPEQNGSGGVDDFELYPTFWFGMAMCDTQSYPEFTKTCTPDSDANIFDNPSPKAPDYIGRHPGTAFMELQFYPPGWVPEEQGGTSCDGTHWCAALTIDSLSAQPEGGKLNNPKCLESFGEEYMNFSFVTTDGTTGQGAALAGSHSSHRAAQSTNILLMNRGDTVTLQMNDTSDGFQVTIDDTTSGNRGSIVASPANGFAQVVFAPNSKSCTVVPYAFHPMYATSGLHTRVPWAAHSYNVAVSWELGHFELCSAVVKQGGRCRVKGTSEKHRDSDDNFCFSAAASTNIQVGGCLAEDNDFDGPSYQNDWPGSLASADLDSQVHPSSALLTSPLFENQSTGAMQNYDQVAFETDMPVFEAGFHDGCSKITGIGCFDPPPGGVFYPFYSIGTSGGGACVWQFGAANIAGTTDTFGGSAPAEFGTDPLPLSYASRNSMGRASSFTHFEDFRTIQPENPCPAPAN